MLASTARPLSLWRDVICPKEHGSWSLAGEPIALALPVAPSAPGALLGLALVAGFFARRPLRAVAIERRPERRPAAWRAVGLCVGGAVAALGAAVVLVGANWLMWLVPAALAGAAFAWCDARGAGRAELAELAGATAFALTPIAIAVLGGWTPAAAVALSVVMVGRAAPSVATVRAFIRAAKTGARHDAFPLGASLGALLAATWLATAGWAPRFAAVALGLFALRSFALLVLFRPAWRARTLGMFEAAAGVLFILGLAATWPV